MQTVDYKTEGAKLLLSSTLLLFLFGGLSTSAWGVEERISTKSAKISNRQLDDKNANQARIQSNHSAVDKPRRSWRDSVLKVHPGGNISFLVNGNAYTNLQQARAMRYLKGNPRSQRVASKPTQQLRARIDHTTRQGTWISVAVDSKAPLGIYWVDGITADRIAKPMPLVLEVVPPSVNIRSRYLLPKNTTTTATTRSKRYSPVADRIPQARQQTTPASRDTLMAARTSQPLVATRPIAGAPIPYQPNCTLTGPLMQMLLDAGGPMPCSGNASVSGASSNTYLLSHSPEDLGIVGGTLTIIAENLTDSGGVRVRHGGQNLSVQSATSSRIVARLPNTPSIGPLVVERTNGEVLGTLNTTYQVSLPPAQIPPLFSDFTGSQTSVTWKLGYQFSMLSWLAYFDGLGSYLQDNPAFANQLGVTVRRTFDETHYGFDICHNASGSMQGAVFEHAPSNTVIIAVRGSQTGNAFQDWWDNDLDGQPFSRLGWALGNTLHCGFHQAAKVVYDELAGELKDDEAAGKKIWVTGHSLGGSAAMLLAAMLEWDANVEVDGVYTYGAPGVGNAIFINAYQDDIPNTHRFELQQDPAVSLFFPLHGRPGRNHLLQANGGFQLNAPQGYLNYIGTTPISDLSGTHMEYWCRGFAELDEATPANLQTMLPLPPSQPGPNNPTVCDTTDFYGSLQ